MTQYGKPKISIGEEGGGGSYLNLDCMISEGNPADTDQMLDRQKKTP